MQKPVYLDYGATTPVDPKVAEAMTACLTLDGNFGNPASRSHIYGWRAEEAVEDARGAIADLLNADPREIVWTSGATESNNLAIKGAASARKSQGNHIITAKSEHKAVLDSCRYLETQGFEVTYLTPQNNGLVSAEMVESAVKESTILVSLMHVNNEIGVIHPIADIGKLCRSKNILLHVDAAQSVGKLHVDVKALNVDLLSSCAHKMYGPKGVGLLYVRRDPDVKIDAQIHGGGHERGMRSGTLATHQIVGFGAAAKVAKAQLEEESNRLLGFRQRFLERIRTLSDIQLNGCSEHRVAGNVNIAIGGVDGETLLMSLRELAVSTGSACTSVSVEPSHVLTAIGLSRELAGSSLRIVFGRFTQEDEVDFAADTLIRTVTTLREQALKHRAG